MQHAYICMFNKTKSFGIIKMKYLFQYLFSIIYLFKWNTITEKIVGK